MESSQSIPAAEVERMMKLQDVLLKAMAKRISWLSAAEIIGVTPRTMRRWRERMEEQGYDGLRDRRKGKTSQRRVALETCEAVLRLYQEKYFDLNVRHFHEKLKEVEGIELSYTWVKQALQGACFRRQSIFGKPVPHLEIPPWFSGSLRLHRGCSRLLPELLSVVQPPAPSFRTRPDDAGHGPSRPGSAHLGASSGGPGRRLLGSP